MVSSITNMLFALLAPKVEGFALYVPNNLIKEISTNDPDHLFHVAGIRPHAGISSFSMGISM
jgi:hypothetical protein